MSRVNEVQTAPPPSLVEQNIQLILRGAAGVLGCRSATYLHVDEAGSTVRIWTGLRKYSDDIFHKVQTLFGIELGGGELEFTLPTGSLVFQAFRTGRIYEASSVQELVGQALPTEVADSLNALVGERLFASVPVFGRAGPMGVILFEKNDQHAFTVRQREMLLSYATRVGLILESERFADNARVVLRDLGSGSAGSPIVLQALERFLEDAAEAMISLDSAQTIVAMNRRAEEMFGRALEDLEHRAFEVLFQDVESSHRVLESRSKLLSEGFFEMRTQLRRGDGSGFPASLSGLVTVDEQGEQTGSIVRIRELSSLDRRDHEEVDLRERLVRSERLAMIGQMAAQMAHEIRNPLVSIGASLRELVTDLDEGIVEPDELRQELTSVSEEVDRLDGILHDYLALARHPTMLPRIVRVGRVIEDAVRVVSQNPTAKRRRIVTELAEDDEVLADADGLRQVFLNLVLNALEASEEGASVVVRTRRAGGEVISEIVDGGKGLPADVQPDRLFEPFVTTKRGGSGLGLAVTRKIVEELGGTISLAPSAGGGAVARVVMPVPGSRGQDRPAYRSTPLVPEPPAPDEEKPS